MSKIQGHAEMPAFVQSRRRDDYLPLAEHLESLLARGDKYLPPTPPGYHSALCEHQWIAADNLVQEQGSRNLLLASVILTSKIQREVGLFKKDGHYFLIQGGMGIRADVIGLTDIEWHTHPQVGDAYAWPSPNDVGALRPDADGKGRVASIDGWCRTYERDDRAPYGRTIGKLERLWLNDGEADSGNVLDVFEPQRDARQTSQTSSIPPCSMLPRRRSAISGPHIPQPPSS